MKKPLISPGLMKSLTRTKKKKKSRLTLSRARTLTTSTGRKLRKASTLSAKSTQYKRFRSGAAGVIEATLPAKVPGVRKEKSLSKRTKYKKTGRPAGRPVGVYKHFIVTPQGERKYVHVYEWRRWIRKQNALRRLSGGERERYPPEPAGELPVREEQRRPEPPRDYVEREEVVKPSDNILDAPNVFRGELRNVGSTSAIQHMDKINKPIINPDGEYFTDVDPFTGKQIVRRRIKERWTHGG